MGAKKFKFVSPGIFLNEIDNSQLPSEPQPIGPLVIGRTKRGPAMRPVQVDSFSEFVEMFGEPIPGGKGEDVWRNGNTMSPTYASYAAQAWLKNSSNCTVVRLLGTEHKSKTTAGAAGWKTSNPHLTTPATDANMTTGNGDAYGLFVFPGTVDKAGTTTTVTTGSLAAIWYVDEGSVGLVGQEAGSTTAHTHSLGHFIKSDSNGQFTLSVKSTSPSTDKKITFSLGAGDNSYIRKVFNTNPTKVNSTVTSDAEPYWLGETYENVIDLNTTRNTNGDAYINGTPKYLGVIAGIHATNQAGATYGHGHKQAAFGMSTGYRRNSRTGWFISQDVGASGSFDAVDMQKLFRFHGLDHGEWAQNNLKISISNIKYSKDEFNKYGTFDIEVRGITDKDKSRVVLESYSGCNLNPNSLDYVARKIGDTEVYFDTSERVLRQKGKYANVSKLIRVEMNSDVDAATTNEEYVPFGVWGPPKYKDSAILVASTSSYQANDEVTTIIGNSFIWGASKGDATNVAGRVWTTEKTELFSGLGDLGTAATAVDAIDTTGYVSSNADASFTISIPARAGGLGGTTVTILLDENQNGGHSGAANRITVGTFDGSESDALAAAYIIDAINGVPTATNARIVYATSGNGEAADDLGITAAQGSSNTQITLTMDNAGTAGNIAGALASVSGLDIIDATGFALGVDSVLRFNFPKVPLRISASQGGTDSNGKESYFGVWTGRTPDQSYTTVHNEGIIDLLRVGASALVDDWDGHSTNTYIEKQFIFTLDDITASADDNPTYYYVSGTRQSEHFENRFTTYRGAGDQGGSVTCETTASNYKSLLDLKINAFTTLMHGGVDGFDITEKDPVRSGLIDGGTSTAQNSYVFNTYKEAIDVVKDPEVVEYNLITAPGLWVEGLTTHMIRACETRADALAIIDLKEDFEPATNSSAGDTYRTSVTSVVTSLKARALNSSYACAYYPWVRIKDTINGSLVHVPPSIAALGAMSYTDKVRAPWFSPAGFNRGGLSTGVAGLPVVGITHKLTSKDRDELYDANINPIASFPNEGIVIFGQKTLQVTRSALDRVNVRRLLLYVKKGVSTISKDILFEPNLNATWDKFINRTNPFLADVKAKFGLTDYKLVLDETTTTPDLIDQNIMYAKIFLKPARAIEFIAVDFVIMNTGAAFED